MSVRVELNRSGVIALLRSPEIAGDLERRAQAIARAAGEGHRVEAEIGRNRARAVIITETIDAKLAEARNRTLTRAVGAGAR